MGWEMRLCTGQHKETKRLHCLQGPLIHYEKDKDISPSARDPLLPNKQFSCWNYSSCSNLFIVRDRMTSSTLQNTKSQQGVFKKYDIRRASWTQLGISCNSATLRLPTVPGFVEIFTILTLLCYSEKARNILVKDLTPHCPKTHTQIIFPKEFLSKLQ